MTALRPRDAIREGSPLARHAHRIACWFARRFPDDERREWAYERMYAWVLRYGSQER